LVLTLPQPVCDCVLCLLIILLILSLSLPGLRMYVIVLHACRSSCLFSFCPCLASGCMCLCFVPADYLVDPLLVFAWSQYVCDCVLCRLIVLFILSLFLPGLSMYVI